MPAVAAGIELEQWTLEQVVAVTEEYLRNTEDAKFEKTFAKAGNPKLYRHHAIVVGAVWIRKLFVTEN
jgi:hypothetical protein